MKRPIIYDYQNYRTYLKDMFCYKKYKNKHFSHRAFAKRVGFSSPSSLSRFINGERNLTSSSLAKVVKGFAIKTKEREYFENLVFMNQASSHDEKNYYYQKMMRLKGFSSDHKIEKSHYEYFSKWYYPVIREIISFGSREYTAKEIANILNPKITVQDAEKALKLLLNLGLINKDQDDKWQRNEKGLTTGPEVSSIIITNFHKEMIKLATESFDRHPVDKRDISGVVLNVNSKSINKIKARIDAFRNELMEMALQEDTTNQVFYVSIQGFPLTHEVKKEKVE